MFRLIYTEWLKWSKQLIFRIVCAFYVILLPSVLLLGKKLPELPPPIGTTEVMFIFPTVWNYLGYIGNWLCFFFFGFFAVISITMEFNNRTLRQNIITGWSRQDVFLAKFGSIGALSLLATLYYVLCALLIGYTHTDVVYLSKVFQEGDIIFRYWLMSFSYMTFGLLIGFLIRRTVIAVFLYLIYIMILEPVLRWGVHRYFWEHPSMHFYPMNATEDLLAAPLSPIAEEFAQKAGFNLFMSPFEAIITTLIYTTVFIFVVFSHLKKADL